MLPSEITRLVGVEYDLCTLDGRLAELAREIGNCPIANASEAARAIRQARRQLRQALLLLDGPLTEAARLAETLTPAPF